MNWWLVAFIALVAFFAFLTIPVVIGAYVTRKYPHVGDPDRSAKRFVRPAFASMILAVVSLIVMIATVVLAFITG